MAIEDWHTISVKKEHIYAIRETLADGDKVHRFIDRAIKEKLQEIKEARE